MKLAGKVTIVTGGTRGLGWAIAQQYADEGATVVCASRSPFLSAPPDRATGRLLYERVDVTDPDAVRSLIDNTVHSHGRVDIVVANAGVSWEAELEDLTVEQWNDTVSTNLSGTFHCIRAAAPHMRRQRDGRIITVSSSAATRPTTGAGAYAATKAAIEMLTRVAAHELGRYGILVTCLSPGALDVGMGRRLMANDKAWANYLDRSSLGRPGNAAEVAQVALFLATPASSYVNGSIIEVNGGLAWA